MLIVTDAFPYVALLWAVVNMAVLLDVR
jgi:hypothetical protein